MTYNFYARYFNQVWASESEQLLMKYRLLYSQSKQETNFALERLDTIKTKQRIYVSKGNYMAARNEHPHLSEARWRLRKLDNNNKRYKARIKEYSRLVNLEK